MSESAFLLYLPVYHQGFAQLFARFPRSRKLYLLSSQDLAPFGPTHKDLHALDFQTSKQLLTSLKRFAEILPAVDNLASLKTVAPLIIPQDEAVQAWVAKYLPKQQNLQVEKVFLRWTRQRALAENLPKAGVIQPLDNRWQEIWQLTKKAGENSSDWWRQVGCSLLLESGELILAYNRHLPDNHTPYIVGDIRSQFHRGEYFELTSAIHAEAAAIAQAAKKGLSTVGASIMVTDFPCPVCAKLIAAAGIKTLYYQRGYALLDGEAILRSFGIKIIKIADSE